MQSKKMLVKVAYYYYKLGLNQQEIGNKLSMSRQKVNRMIKKALQEGIVEINIKGYESYSIDLESALEKKFNLKEVIVVQSGEDVGQRIGNAGSKYLEKTVTDNMIIGVSWGKTLSSIVENISQIHKNNVSVVQLVGGLNTEEVSIKPEEITKKIALAINAKAFNLYAPAIVGSPKVKKILESEQSFKKIEEKIKNTNLAIVGIGQLSKTSTVVEDNYVSQMDYESLIKRGCVGDICLTYFDINGKVVDEEFDSRVMGIKGEDLRNIEKVVGIAYGHEKIRAIIGTLRGKYIDVLITDSETAQGLIDFDKKED